VTEAETFIWYQANPRVSLGVAHLAKQNAFRWLASVNIVPETAKLPALNASAGVQGIGTGNPGYSLTGEKNWSSPQGSFNFYAGLGLRSNESHAHGLFGFKYTTVNNWAIGLQNEGHQTHPFITYSFDQMTAGIFLINGKNLATMIGVRL
jgi:hypothetical protein